MTRLSLCLSLWALFAFACDPAAADASSGELSWAVESNGSTVANLFGTLHTRSLDNARTFHPKALATFDKSTVLYVETDLSAIDVARFSERALLSSAAAGLDTQLTPAEWEQLSLATRDLIEIDVLRRVRPWYAVQLYLRATVPSLLETDVKPMDLALIDAARARGAEVRFLEPWEEQVFAVSITTDVAQLKASLALGATELERAQRDLEAEWERGDASALDARIGALNAEQQRFLFRERNERWVSVIQAAISNGDRSIFVAVGAGHLVGGAKGLPGLLRAGRLTVSRRP